jgi:DNA-binding NtrC family response regulator
MVRILLVEDDDNVRLLLEHVLLHEGYAVETAGTVTRGEKLLQDGNYDLVLTDAKLPDGNGVKIADAAARKGLKTLIITGYAFTLPVGAQERHDVLLKPVRPAELIQAIERVLSP